MVHQDLKLSREVGMNFRERLASLDLHDHRQRHWGDDGTGEKKVLRPKRRGREGVGGLEGGQQVCSAGRSRRNTRS